MLLLVLVDQLLNQRLALMVLLVLLVVLLDKQQLNQPNQPCSLFRQLLQGYLGLGLDMDLDLHPEQTSGTSYAP